MTRSPLPPRATAFTFTPAGYQRVKDLVTQEEVTHSKPHPESLLRVLALMLAEARLPDTGRALFAGDTAVDVAAGKAAGVWKVGVS